MAIKYARARAVGVGEFPIDMLRYDRCFPENESDTDRLLDAGNPEEREVWVMKAFESRGAHWTHARWRSFGWRLEVPAFGEVRS